MCTQFTLYEPVYSSYFSDKKINLKILLKPEVELPRLWVKKEGFIASDHQNIEMHSNSRLQHNFFHQPQNHNRCGKVPTLCISAPDDIYQEKRDALWSFQTRNRGPASILADANSKLCPEDPITAPTRTLAANNNKSLLIYRHQFNSNSFPARNFTMSNPGTESGKTYRFDIPEVTPKLNARFNPGKRVIPSIQGPSVVGKGMNLKHQASYSSLEFQTDEEDEQDQGNEYLTKSLQVPYSSVDDGLSSIVIRSLQAEREQLITSSSEETPSHINSDNAIETVPNVNHNLAKETDAETFIKVPTADTHFTNALEVSSGISRTDDRHRRAREHEMETRIIVRKRYSKTKRKSKRNSKDEPVLFAYKQSGSSSSLLSYVHPDGSIVEEEQTQGKHCLKDILDNYIVQCSNYDDNSRHKFNDMVNTKEVLDESLYDEYARFCDRPPQIRKDSTVLHIKNAGGDDNRSGIR